MAKEKRMWKCGASQTKHESVTMYCCKNGVLEQKWFF